MRQWIDDLWEHLVFTWWLWTDIIWYDIFGKDDDNE